MSKQLYNINENYREKFYQVPKVFFTNSKYTKLSNDTKMAWSLLKNRLDLSLKNNWIDEKGNIYFIYSNEKLMDILNCGKEKLSKIKKSLIDADLLVQKRQGLNKPNKLYLVKPEITKDDIYKIEKVENDFETSSDKDVRKSNVQKFENRTSRSSKIERPEVRKSNTSNTEFSNTEFSDTEFSDTNDLYDIYKNISTENNHSYHTNYQQTKFNNDALKFQILEELPMQIKDYLKNFEIKEIRIIKSVLLKGKKSFNNTHDTVYRLEDVEFELVNVLKRFKAMLLKKHESVEAMQGYLMQSIKAELEEIHALNIRRQNIPKYNIFNQ